MSYELYIPEIPKKKHPYKIEWTPEMIKTIKEKFPKEYNRELANELGISMRTLIRKARELGIEKEDGFLMKRKEEIQVMARKKRRPNSTKGLKGWCVPNSEATRFKPGNISPMSVDPGLVEKVRIKRNKTIARERARLRMGLEPLTRLNIKI